MRQLWCEPPEDGESHCWESEDEGDSWRDAGQMDGTPGFPEIIDINRPCPRCGSPLRAQ